MRCSRNNCWPVFLLWIAVGSLIPAATLTASPSLLQQGEAIYRDGVLPDGNPLRAMVNRDVVLEGEQAACMRCHQRSGLGSMEGQTVVPAINGNALFSPDMAFIPEAYRAANVELQQRAVYTDASLQQALRDGVNAANQHLDILMPRYALNDEASRALFNYLRTLSRQISPGVDPTAVHFATIIHDSVDESVASAHSEILEAFFSSRNQRTRAERHRAEKAPFHKAWKYEAYRDWKLHVWTLNGNPGDWRRQLEQQYAAQPVFAVIGGMAEGSWAPVHSFCHDQRLPCLFPQTDLPVTAEVDFYTPYFSSGIIQDAAVLAGYLASTDSDSRQPVIQVYRQGHSGEAAARQLRKSLPNDSVVEDIAVPAFVPLDRRFWEDHLPAASSFQLVLWLNDDDLAGLPAMITGSSSSRFFVSNRLVLDPVASMRKGLRERMIVINPFCLPEELQRRSRQALWLLKKQGKTLTHSRIQLNSFFSVRLAGEAMMHIRSNFYRDYFLERIEHLVDRLGHSAALPKMTLGPGQRIAAEGAYLMAVQPGSDDQLVAISDWLKPVWGVEDDQVLLTGK